VQKNSLKNKVLTFYKNEKVIDKKIL